MSDPHGHHRPSDYPQKWGSVALGAAAIFVAGWMTWESMEPHPAKIAKDVDGGVVASTLTAASTPSPTSTAIVLLDASAATIDLDASLAMPALNFGDASSLPTTAPRSVKVGIVFVTFAGAEGAPPNARPRTQAKEIADGLLPMAHADFHAAVNKGDSGSADDIGRIPRGVLDPAVEAAVFGLSTNDVSEVVETSKGFWIVKRLD